MKKSSHVDYEHAEGGKATNREYVDGEEIQIIYVDRYEIAMNIYGICTIVRLYVGKSGGVIGISEIGNRVKNALLACQKFRNGHRDQNGNVLIKETYESPNVYIKVLNKFLLPKEKQNFASEEEKNAATKGLLKKAVKYYISNEYKQLIEEKANEVYESEKFSIYQIKNVAANRESVISSLTEESIFQQLRTLMAEFSLEILKSGINYENVNVYDEF